MQHSTAALPCPRGVPPPPYGTRPGQKALPDEESDFKACCRLLHVQKTFRFQVIYYLLAKIGLDTAENGPILNLAKEKTQILNFRRRKDQMFELLLFFSKILNFRQRKDQNFELSKKIRSKF